MPIQRSDAECFVKLLIFRGSGACALRSHSSFADDKVPGDLIPKMQALNLLENKIIRSA